MLDFLWVPATVLEMNSITTLTPQQLRQAADVKERIDALQDQLNEILGGEIPAPFGYEPQPPATNGRRKRRKQVSAGARARMSASQRARRAAERGEGPADLAPATTEGKPAKQRNISEAGRKALSLAAKKKWAKFRAAKKAEAAKREQVSEARLAALAKAREARLAKLRAAEKGKE